VARELNEIGIKAYVIIGGLSGWRKAKLPVEPVPREEVVPLPRFA
jgi:rhodanese-related sulfurtransferase